MREASQNPKGKFEKKAGTKGDGDTGRGSDKSTGDKPAGDSGKAGSLPPFHKAGGESAPAPNPAHGGRGSDKPPFTRGK